jgi:hypothetical protein
MIKRDNGKEGDNDKKGDQDKFLSVNTIGNQVLPADSSQEPPSA